MLKIRLARTGKRNQASHRIVVIDKSKKRDGQYLESLGFYQPGVKPSVVKLNQKRYLYWLDRGAQPSKTVASLAQKFVKPTDR